MKYSLGNDRVEMADDAWIADSAAVIGKVSWRRAPTSGLAR